MLLICLSFVIDRPQYERWKRQYSNVMIFNLGNTKKLEVRNCIGIKCSKMHAIFKSIISMFEKAL